MATNNAIRADRGGQSLEEYASRTGYEWDDIGDRETALVDLLSDLHHAADEYDLDFEKAAEMAETHYNAEKDEEGTR